MSVSSLAVEGYGGRGEFVSTLACEESLGVKWGCCLLFLFIQPFFKTLGRFVCAARWTVFIG